MIPLSQAMDAVQSFPLWVSGFVLPLIVCQQGSRSLHCILQFIMQVIYIMAIAAYVVACASLTYAAYAARTTCDLHTFCVVKVYVPIVFIFHLWWWFRHLHVTCLVIVDYSAENVDAYEGGGDDDKHEDSSEEEEGEEGDDGDDDEDEEDGDEDGSGTDPDGTDQDEPQEDDAGGGGGEHDNEREDVGPRPSMVRFSFDIPTIGYIIYCDVSCDRNYGGYCLCALGLLLGKPGGEHLFDALWRFSMSGLVVFPMLITVVLGIVISVVWWSEYFERRKRIQCIQKKIPAWESAWKKAANVFLDDTTCAICMSECEATSCMMPCCGKSLHKRCVVEMVVEHGIHTCPLCRHALL